MHPFQVALRTLSFFPAGLLSSGPAFLLNITRLQSPGKLRVGLAQRPMCLGTSLLEGACRTNYAHLSISPVFNVEPTGSACRGVTNSNEGHTLLTDNSWNAVLAVRRSNGTESLSIPQEVHVPLDGRPKAHPAGRQMGTEVRVYLWRCLVGEHVNLIQLTDRRNG